MQGVDQKEILQGQPNPKKTKVIPITEEILFLGFHYRLTETGKIIVRLNLANVKQERKKLWLKPRKASYQRLKLMNASTDGKATQQKEPPINFKTDGGIL